MYQSSMSQSNCQSRQTQTTHLLAPSLLLSKSLYPMDPLPTIATLDTSSTRYPTRSAISSAQCSAPSAEDELHSESEGQQGDAKQESGEGGTTSDFVKKLYRSAFEPQLDVFVP